MALCEPLAPYSKSSESQAGDRAEIESERDMGSTLK